MSSSWEDPPKTVQEDTDKDHNKSVQEDPPKDHTESMQGDLGKDLQEWGISTPRGNWTFLKDKSEVRCNLCMRNLNLTGVPASKFHDLMAAHAASKGHREKKNRILEEEENKRLEDIYKELVQSKVREILDCVEDHPKFLNHQWIPLGSFLKVWKMAFRGPPYEIASEFLVTPHHDESEIIFEIMEWLDKDS